MALVKALKIAAGLVRQLATGDLLDPAHGGMPTGALVPFAGSTIPSGYLECDGGTANRVTYADLFAVIGTTWGTGDGSTTFGLPDLKGRAAIGAGTGSGLTARTLGTKVGAETVGLSATHNGPHSHGPATGYEAFWVRDSNNSIGTGTLSFPASGNLDNAVTLTGQDGSGTPHDNVQPCTVVKYLIKT